MVKSCTLFLCRLLEYSSGEGRKSDSITKPVVAWPHLLPRSQYKTTWLHLLWHWREKYRSALHAVRIPPRLQIEKKLILYLRMCRCFSLLKQCEITILVSGIFFLKAARECLKVSLYIPPPFSLGEVIFHPVSHSPN